MENHTWQPALPRHLEGSSTRVSFLSFSSSSYFLHPPLVSLQVQSVGGHLLAVSPCHDLAKCFLFWTKPLLQFPSFGFVQAPGIQIRCVPSPLLSRIGGNGLVPRIPVCSSSITLCTPCATFHRKSEIGLSIALSLSTRHI